MEAFNKVMDKVKSHPEVVEKVKDEVRSLADALHLRKHDKEPEAEEKATAQSADGSASADKAEGDPSVLEQAVEEIQAVAAALQQQHQTAPAAETETGTEVPVEAAAAAETSAAAGEEKPEGTNRDAEKDDPKKRLDFLGFFAMLFERFCNPGNKKKD